MGYSMIKEKEVNYKIERIRKDCFVCDYLVIDSENNSHWWSDDFDVADMFDTIELAKEICKHFDVKFDYENYNYYIIEDSIEFKL